MISDLPKTDRLVGVTTKIYRGLSSPSLLVFYVMYGIFSRDSSDPKIRLTRNLEKGDIQSTDCIILKDYHRRPIEELNPWILARVRSQE